MMIRPATSDDAEALAALHLDVWDEAYTGLVPQRILDARRASPSAQVELWRAILWVLDGNERAIALYRRQGFAFDGATRTDDVGTESRMVRM